MKGRRFSTPHPRPQALRQNAAGFHAKSVASPHCMTVVRASTETYTAADKHMDDADALALHKDTASGTNSLGKLPAAAARRGEPRFSFPLSGRVRFLTLGLNVPRARPLNKRMHPKFDLPLPFFVWNEGCMKKSCTPLSVSAYRDEKISLYVVW